MNIFVTIGTKDYPFDRLIKAMDKEGVVMQIGKSSKPTKAKFFEFLKKQEIEDWMNWSEVIVCHAGTGTLMEAIDSGKRIVVVPRQEKFKEHIDDHQVDFAKYLEKHFSLKIVYDENELGEAIKKSTVPKNIKKNDLLIDEIKRIVLE
ncbi:MAG: glycosyltransferase [archaeon]